jgi:hypothetical protein
MLCRCWSTVCPGHVLDTINKDLGRMCYRRESHMLEFWPKNPARNVALFRDKLRPSIYHNSASWCTQYIHILLVFTGSNDLRVHMYQYVAELQQVEISLVFFEQLFLPSSFFRFWNKPKIGVQLFIIRTFAKLKSQFFANTGSKYLRTSCTKKVAVSFSAS